MTETVDKAACVVYRGILRADADNLPDGAYPVGWRGFTVTSKGGVVVSVHAPVGGVRDHLMTMAGHLVDVSAPPPLPVMPSLTFARWQDVRIAGGAP